MSKIEYFFIEYLPNVDGRRTISIAVVLFDAEHMEDGICKLMVAPQWQAKVLIFDPHADLKLLESLLSEIRDRLFSPIERVEMVRQLEDSFSNNVQVSARRPGPSNSSAEIIENFARALFSEASAASGVL
jgi:hypothetical protein